MPTYIATVWSASSVALAVEGNTALSRTVIRMRAESPAQFEARTRDNLGQARDVDMAVEFGPIGLSKHQGADHA